jgi:hypothetical protein
MKRFLSGLALAAALFGASQAQALIIDNFSASNPPGNCGAFFETAGQCAADPAVGIPLSPNSSTNTLGSLLQGTGGATDRTISVDLVSGSLARAGINVDNVDGLTFDNAADTQSRLTLNWSPTNPVDLTAPSTGFEDQGASDFFIWHITALDLNLLATIILEDADGTVAGNAFLKLPDEDPVDICTGANAIVCIQPVPGGDGPPGNLYHGFAPFNAGGTDPATGLSFFDDPLNPGADTDLAPTGGTTAGLDFTQIVSITTIFDTSGNTGSPGLDVSELCFSTGPLLGTPVAANETPGANNNIGVNQCAVPEPSAVLLMGSGLLGVGLVGLRAHIRRRRQQA